MKLLLTSGGFTNPSISKALFELVGKKPEETSLVFVPTASHMEVGDKGWFINDLVNVYKQGFASVDIADISAVEEKIWRSKFDAADIIYFEGGNTFHLMEWINKSGLAKLLPEYLKTKVWVGVSAGSIVTGPDLMLRTSQIIYGEDLDRTEDMPALGLVDFYVVPHLDSSDFPNLREAAIREASKGVGRKTYALDDQSAVKVVDGKEEVVSEGKWFVVE